MEEGKKEGNTKEYVYELQKYKKKKNRHETRRLLKVATKHKRIFERELKAEFWNNKFLKNLKIQSEITSK